MPPRDYKVTKVVGKHSATTIFARPFELRLGSVVNFMVTRTDASAIGTVVSVLIEIDLK